MLENLHEINWSALKHAGGSASDVPDLLEGLLSEDQSTRSESIYQLFGTIWHQGSVYQASSYAVPFLFELLALPDERDCAFVAMLLAELADGVSHLAALNDQDSPILPTLRQAFEQEGRDFDEEVRLGRIWAERTRQAVGAQLDLLFPYLQDEEPEVRETIARCLARFPDRAGDTIPLLEKAWITEPEDYVKESMQKSLSRLRGQGCDL